ncbi:MAG: SulP family inorganic anion transporter [Myxococcales bacterium]|nr:SulP family inorganic anion transporter [Myxococcales bacterium]
MKTSLFAHPQQDIVAGVVVFLVALPLCLGIAIASGVPPISGLIAGIVGGLVVPLISRAPLSVSGPAAGLASVVAAEVGEVGLNAFLTAVVLAGAIQVGLGWFRAGRYSALVPSSVIKGMLAAIGITIILKQIPVALGASGSITHALEGFHPGALAIAAVSLGILLSWPYTPMAKITWLPSALVVVVVGTAMGLAFGDGALGLQASHLVSVPSEGPAHLWSVLPHPDPEALLHENTWMVAMTVAAVASIETLLSLQAVDRLDPLHRKSPPDTELMAQGVGNMVSGLLGGIPMTSVIVRSGANAAAGGRTRLSAMVHGVLLLVAVLLLAPLLGYVPLACLAAVLIHIGFKLARPALFVEQYRLGFDQLAPFGITIAAILIEDLLVGVIIGVLVGIAFVLRQHARGVVALTMENGEITVRLRRDGTFVAKPAIQAALEQVPDDARVVFDATGEYVDHDVKELVAEFSIDAARRGVEVETRGFDLSAVGAGGH